MTLFILTNHLHVHWLQLISSVLMRAACWIIHSLLDGGDDGGDGSVTAVLYSIPVL